MSKINTVQSINSIKKMVVYLMETEAENFEERRLENPGVDPEKHIYTHAKRVRRWLHSIGHPIRRV